MSIINDALKKAEKERQDFPKSQQKRWPLWLGIGLVCLLGIILLTNIKGPAESKSGQGLFAAKEPAAGVFKMRKVDFEIPTKASDFNLSGILYDRDKPMAIINKSVVAEGDALSGADILEIQPNFVRLSYRGKELILQVK